MGEHPNVVLNALRGQVQAASGGSNFGDFPFRQNPPPPPGALHVTFEGPPVLQK